MARKICINLGKMKKDKRKNIEELKQIFEIPPVKGAEA